VGVCSDAAINHQPNLDVEEYGTSCEISDLQLKKTHEAKTEPDF
jgi:hypothetical protein